MQRTCSVYKQANNALKDCDEKEERLMLLEAWKEFEVSIAGWVTLCECTGCRNNFVSTSNMCFMATEGAGSTASGTVAHYAAIIAHANGQVVQHADIP